MRENWPGRAEPNFQRDIVFDHVRFSYGARRVLEDINLTITRGGLTTLIGPSGAGKSTLIDLLTGLQQPETGEVLIDGQKLQDLDIGAWRRQIGYVPQDVVLLNDTIRANVTFGEPNIPEHEIEEAITAAGLSAFVAQLPKGLETKVGERGTFLSGGQRQRIAIARALLAKPALLILDEATSALDPETERAICDHVRGLTGNLTVLAITHQPAWIQVADAVYRLEHSHLLSA